MPPDIDALVLRVQAGDRAAYDDVVLALHRDLAAFVGARLPVPQVVEEIVQDAFVCAYERIGDYEPRGTFAAWVKGIARNLLLKRLERYGRERRDGDAVEQALARLALAESPADQDAADARWQARAGRLSHCLGRLTPQARQVLHLRYVEAVPLARMAQRLKRTTAALANLLTRIKGSLRTCLDRPEALEQP
jgi:RNA polymerase sigma-70 factor (ECF subfamily)